MALVFNGTTNVISGVAVGGLPDGIVDTDMLAANAVATAKIADDAVTDAKENLSGTAKVWVNFDGNISTPAARGSFNVSSIGDEGTGEYFINFASALANINYCVVTSGFNTGNSDGSWVSPYAGQGSQWGDNSKQTTTGCKIVSYTYNGGYQDNKAIGVAIFGD